MTNRSKAAAHLATFSGAAILYDDLHQQTGYAVGSDAHMTPDFVNFLAFHAKGLVSFTVSQKVQKQLELPPMHAASKNRSSKEMLVSIDHVSTTTGISAAERACSMKASLDPEASPKDFQRPGHVFPCLTAPGSLTERTGPAEGADFLMRKLHPESRSAVFSEILNEKGNIASLSEIRSLSAFHGCPVYLLSDLVEEAIQQRSWLKVVDHIVAEGTDGIHVLTVRDTLQEQTFKLYTTLENSGSPSIVSYTPCEQGDLLRHGRCSCTAHFEEYYAQLQRREIDAIAFYSMQPLAAPPSDSLGHIIHEQQQKLLEKHRLPAYG